VNPDDQTRAASPRFVTTQWNVVLLASKADSPGSAEALQELCRAYWYPLYAYVRRRGHGPEDAQDLTQEFFARLLEKNWLAEIEPEGGRFRSFLLVALNRFLANEYDRARAAKRGGRHVLVPLQTGEEETRYLQEPATDETPEKVFERRWALAVLDAALKRLRDEMLATGKARQHELLSQFLSREAGPGDYAQVGAALGLSSGAVGVAVHRLRQRYRELVREEIGRTVSSPTQIGEELRHLFAALSG
jgi:RNA polymerase sigma-70 factor (ECF subfamily)